MKTLFVSILMVMVTLTLGHHVSASERSASDLERDLTSKPKQILKFLGVKEGDSVLDFLGGGGYYSQILKEKVGTKGTVVLHTNKAYLSFVGKALKERTDNGGLTGVVQLVSEVEGLQLGENKFDSAILVLGYHDFFFEEGGWSFPADKVIPQLLLSLKEGGKLLIIDHAAESGAGISATKTLHRIDENYVKNDLSKRGFKLIAESQVLRNKDDIHSKSVFEKELRRKTDRFVFLFEKI